MVRQSVSFAIAIYAIGFAFAAMAAVRWPSLVAAGALFADGTGAAAELQGLADWRGLGILYGAPYLFAAIFFYAASTQVQRARHGAVISFLAGGLIGFPPFLIFDFQDMWWQSPTLFETIILAAAGLTLVLFLFVWDLSPAKRQSPPQQHPVEDHLPVDLPVRAEMKPVKPVVRRRPVPPAIARQRACFAAYGRRELEKRAGRI